jgi:anti-sigma factor RsiW
LDCREFQDRLTRYLEGALDAADFDTMVRHEADCDACHRLASERMPHATPATADASGVALTAEILRRTLGADCRQIELSLAEEIDGALPVAERERVGQHLAECADCRALALALRQLPEAYRTLPRLHAGAAFTRAVLARTLPARPGFLSVMRRMWQGPALLWEGAFVCSLLLTPVLGGPAQQSASRLRGELHQARLGLTGAVFSAERRQVVRTDLLTAGNRTEERILDLSAWARRQLSIVWNGGASAPDSTRARPEAGTGGRNEGGDDELRKP